jgi:RNA polymerase sigma-70 factor (ECF subfamily)
MVEPPNQDEWRRWIADHAPKLLLFARQMARSEADAQDLVQEALVECWQRNGARPPPLAWLFATIRRRAIDLARREDRRMNREQTVAVNDTQPWFDAGVEQREFSRMIQAAMAELPPEQREVITLKIWGEMTFAEIGEALGIPANTAASRFRYGLSELRKLTKQVLT